MPDTALPELHGASNIKSPPRKARLAQMRSSVTGRGHGPGFKRRAARTARGLPEPGPPIHPPTRSLTHPGCMSTRVRGCGRRHDATPVGSGLVKDASPQAPKTTVMCYVTEKCPKTYEDAGEQRTVCVWGRAV